MNDEHDYIYDEERVVFDNIVLHYVRTGDVDKAAPTAKMLINERREYFGYNKGESK